MKGRRVVFTAPGNAELQDFELPDLEDGSVLVENEYSAVSAGTERACLAGMPNTPGRFPMYPGYSSAGRVVSSRSRAGPGAGDRVVLMGRHASHCVAQAENLLLIDDASVSSREAAFLVIAAHSLQGVRKARIELGEHVCVIGLGLLGLFAVQFARLNGGHPVTAFDYDESRRFIAEGLGADYSFSPGDGGFERMFRESGEGGGADVVIEVTGYPEALQQALLCAAFRARVIALGCTRNPVRELDVYSHVHKPGISIIGAHTSVRPSADYSPGGWSLRDCSRSLSSPGYWTMRDDMRTLLGFLASGRMKVAPVIGRTAAPEEASDVFGKIAAGKDAAPGVVFDWTGGKA